MKRNKIMLTALFYLITLSVLGQQNIQYGQYIANGLYINPAYAGYKDAMFLQAVYRNQWTGVKGAPQSMSVSFDMPIEEKNLGVGIIVSKDKIGAQSLLDGCVNLAYRLRMDYTDNKILAFGIGAGIMQSSINGNLLDPTELGDMSIPTGFESRTIPDLRLGVQYSSEGFFIGLAANNLFSKHFIDNSSDLVSKLNTQSHLYLTSSIILPLNMDFKFKPSFLLKDDRHGPTSLDLNAFLIVRDKFWFGGIYRTSISLFPKSNLQAGLTKRSSIGFIADFLIQEKFRVGYGFDYSVNKLATQEYGSHEISVGYYFSVPKDRKSLFFCF